ncbi:hypothetical protein SALBM217S_05837 [Streptomyces griseoloalbus]
MRGEIAVGDGRADAHRAVLAGLDPVEREGADVDEPGGGLDAVLHQVDEVGAAAEVAGVRVGVEQGDRAGDVVGAPVVELPHAAVPSVTAVSVDASAAARATASAIWP